MTLASGERYVWIAVILVGSLLESAYMFRWFGRTLHPAASTDRTRRRLTDLLPVAAMALLLAVSGYVAADLAGLTAHWTICRSLRDSRCGCSARCLDRYKVSLRSFWSSREAFG